MSYALYDDLGGLRFWTPREVKRRQEIADQLASEIEHTLRSINQMWRVVEVETPPLQPLNSFSAAYERDDVFILMDPPGGEQPYALRAETTNGTFLIAAQMLRDGSIKAPACVFQNGYSFRRETSDGATAAKLRFNAFRQLEFQMIVSLDTKAPFEEAVRNALVPVVRRLTGLETRLIPSDRLPSYATETIDIECLQPDGEWREVASTSLRTDFPQVPGHKPLRVFEVAFGLDRLTVLSFCGEASKAES